MKVVNAVVKAERHQRTQAGQADWVKNEADKQTAPPASESTRGMGGISDMPMTINATPIRPIIAVTGLWSAFSYSCMSVDAHTSGCRVQSQFG